MFVSYLVNPLLVRQFLFRPVLSFERVQHFPPYKTDREAHLMYGHHVTYTLHKSMASVSSVRGDEFCHWITKNSACFVRFLSVTNLFAGLTKPLYSTVVSSLMEFFV